MLLAAVLAFKHSKECVCFLYGIDLLKLHVSVSKIVLNFSSLGLFTICLEKSFP